MKTITFTVVRPTLVEIRCSPNITPFYSPRFDKEGEEKEIDLYGAILTFKRENGNTIVSVKYGDNKIIRLFCQPGNVGEFNIPE